MPTNNEIISRYYPQLSDLITLDDLPDFLDFAKDGLSNLLGNIHYKNFQYSKGQRSDSTFYKIDVISKNLGLDLPFGLRFVLNPDVDGDTSISSFPITLQYQWAIFSFLRSFDLSSVSLDPEGIFQLGLDIFKITEAQLISHSINFFVTPADDSTTKYQQLIDDINVFVPSANLSIPSGQTASVSLMVTLISQNGNITQSLPELLFSLYLLDSDSSVTKIRLQQFYNLIVPGGIQSFIDGLVKPHIKASLTLTAGIEFPTNVLQPVDIHGVVLPNTKTVFQFAEATFYVDTDSGIGSQLELAGSLIPQYSQIGTTGLVISFTGAKLDLSQTTNIPEADAAGYPVDFMGLYIKQASITFGSFGSTNPNNPSASITATNFLIGTGGISGTIAVADQGIIYRDFGNFTAELDKFSMTFRHNTITDCSISGLLTLSKFQINNQPAKVAIQAQIKDNGQFSITALPVNGALPLTFPGVFEIDVRSLGMGNDPKGYYIEIAGTLNFTAQVPVLGDVLPKGITIKKFRIYEDGSFQFALGSITLGISFKLSIGPVDLEVSNMSLGPYTKKVNGINRNYAFFGFDGMVNTGSAGVEASGNGIKYYFTIDDDGDTKKFDSFLSVDRIAIDLTIPGGSNEDDADFILFGSLSMKNPDPNIPGSTAGTEYGGSIGLKIPPLGIGGSGAMRLNPSVPSFIVDIDIDFSTPLLLGSTGLGIYGFRGLIGNHYVPSKSATTPPLPATASWWDYYKAPSANPPHLEGIALDKFADKPGFSIGAGISIATAFDSGLIFSSKLFIMLGLPDVFLIQGQAGILQSRIGIDDKTDPPFSALIAIDSTSFAANLAVNYKLPSSGSDAGLGFVLQGMLELAFFFNNPSAWYLNIGRDTPTTARVQAKVLTLFQGYAYLMMSSQGFKAGAGASFDFNKSFGPVGVAIGANLDMGAFVSFKPVQIGGFIQFGGYAFLKVFWIKVGLSIQVTLAIEAPRPFNIHGSLAVKIHTPWPLPNVKFSLDITWHFNDDKSVLQAPVPIIELPDPVTGYLPATALNILSQETFPINYVNQIYTGTASIPAPGANGWKYNFADAVDVTNVTIPLDSYIDIELRKPVLPGQVLLGGTNSQLPSAYTELLPPVKGISAQVQHMYNLTGLNIYAWNDNGAGGGSWVPYNIYEASTAIVQENTGPGAIDLSTLPSGYWQFSDPNKFNKIRLLSQTMFSYANGQDIVSSDLDNMNFQRKDLFCYETVAKQNVTDWKEEQLDTVYPDDQTVMIGGLSFTFNDAGASVKVNDYYGDKSLSMATTSGSLLIELPTAATSYELDFGPNQNDFTVTPVQVIKIPAPFGRTISLDKALTATSVTKSQQNPSISYNDVDVAVKKILIAFSTAQPVDFNGNLLIGGYYQLPDQYLAVTTPQFHHEVDADKALMFAALYNKSYNAADVMAKQYLDSSNAVGSWPLDSALDALGHLNGLISGYPEKIAGYYQTVTGQPLTGHSVYNFTSNASAIVIPYQPALKVEAGSFAFEVTAIFNPFGGGISTLLSKVNTDPVTGYKRGFALHLYQDNPGIQSDTYTGASTVPTFKIWLTFYGDLSSSGIMAQDIYTIDCSTSQLAASQYKHVFVSVDRDNHRVDIYIDRVLKSSAAIPDELNFTPAQPGVTYLDQLSYQTEEMQRIHEDSGITPAKVISEVQVLNDNINKTVQPVWRPNTTFAIAIKTKDVVDKNQGAAIEYTQIFGFRTAGPVGHFQQQSAVYKALADQDKADQFKLANLKSYIDYNRSYPDAEGRFNLSKPVLYHNPQVKLFFTAPYMNAMYSGWDAYQGLSAVQSRLDISLLDPFGTSLSPALVWVQLPDVTIDASNYKTLPADQQLIFLMDQAASNDSCNPQPVSITKKKKQGVYEFPDLIPGKMYTAIFNAVYQPTGVAEAKVEVYRFNFISSRYATFQDQAGSLILDDTPGAEKYALYRIATSFTDDQITQTLINLIDDNTDNDQASVLRYAVKFDRLVYGGLMLTNLAPVANSEIELIVNTDPSNAANKKILGILVRNPESFNDPKLPATELATTVQLTLTKADNTTAGPDQFIYIHSGDTSSVFITNPTMNIPAGSIQLDFHYKIFNGTDYDHEDYSVTGVPIS